MEISVIVATYNQESTLARTLDSILCQDCNATYEILIADDCSADATETVSRRYAKNYPDKIRYIRRKSNLGLVRNYFTAITEANGRFIADCAGDDFWIDPSKLQRQYDTLNANPNITLVHTAWQCYDPSDDTIAPAPYNPSDYPEWFAPIVDGKKLLVPIIDHKLSPLVHLCTAMYRRDLVLSAMKKYPELFESPWLKCEDLQITAMLALEGNFAYLPQITLNYTVIPGTISQQTNPEKAFYFHYSSYRLVKLLQNICSVPFEKLNSYYDKTGCFLAKLMFNTHNNDIRSQAKQLLSHTSAAHSPYMLLTANNTVWNISFHIKNQLKSIIK